MFNLLSNRERIGVYANNDGLYALAALFFQVPQHSFCPFALCSAAVGKACADSLRCRGSLIKYLSAARQIM